MALKVTGIGPASAASELAGIGDEFVVVLSGTKDDCKAAAHLLFEEVSLHVEKSDKEQSE